ncbi:MAG: L,D-transpeptidase family protein [Methyloceanibacter sp.]
MGAQFLIQGGAFRLAKKALFTSTTWVGVAALVVAVAAAPAEAQTKRKSAAKQIEDPIPDPANGQPMTLIISLNQQKIDVYRGTTLITSAGVSTGMRGYATKAGVYSILEKRRHHRSNLYSGAPMPWMQRLTWTGTALHAGVLPGYPASHGCIRLPFSFAPKLFAITTAGEHAVVARDRVAPALIEHANLFQPQPAPEPPVMAKEQPAQRQSRHDIAPGAGLPVVLARAEVSSITTDVPSTLELTPSEPQPPSKGAHAAADHDADNSDRVHAIDPFAGPSAEPATGHAIALVPVTEEAPAEIAPSEEARTTLSEAVAEETAPQLETAAAAVIPAVAVAPASDETLSAPPVLSGMAAKLDAGTKAAGIEAAEPRSTAPLRILVTRRTKQDRIIDMQNTLAAMGHLDAQNFDGTLGRQTVNAIRSFQKEHDLPATGAFSEELMTKVYQVAGKEEPPVGHLFVRQEFGKVFDTPVNFRDPDAPLGTHLFTAMKFTPNDTKTKWMAISLQGDDSAVVLDRLEIPDDVRRKISERLTPGSSLIVGDVAINSATLPKGADFLVWTKDASSNVQRASIGSDSARSRTRARRQTVRPQNNDNFGFFQRRQQQQRNHPGWRW